MEVDSAGWTGVGWNGWGDPNRVTVDVASEIVRTTMRAMDWPVDEDVVSEIARDAAEQVSRAAVIEFIKSRLEPYGRTFGWVPN